MTDSKLVREFTKAAGQQCPTIPELMNENELFFLAKMMLDEIMEMCATVNDPIDYKYKLVKMIVESKDVVVDYKNMEKNELIAEQADALVDCYYYSLNAMAKKGVNLSSIFKLVHEANMKKRDPETGMFIKREDGKIVKPDNWEPPDIVAEINRQIKEFSF
jgi:predicted HAD superfamily Cof-like phosphohydrolase